MSDLIAFQAQFVAQLDRAGSTLSAMTVYRNTSLSSTAEALADNYPVVRTLVGDDLFGALALGFIQAVPPASPVLATYGQSFPDWLESQPVARDLSYLADVARCERAFLESHFAADAMPLDAGDLAALPPERLPGLRLRLHPAARFGWLSTPAIDVWLAHRGPVDGETIIDWRARGHLFTRPHLEVFAQSIDRPLHRMLSGLRLGETLGEAAGATSKLYPEADPGRLLAALLEAGALVQATQRN